jgi:hypothetical protein
VAGAWCQIRSNRQALEHLAVSGDVAQLGERRLCKADVRGSNPLISTWLREKINKSGGWLKAELCLGGQAELGGQPEGGREEARAPYQPNRVRKKKAQKERKKRKVSNSPYHGEKLLRAYGGCLGAKCRRRTWDTAKSLG